MRGAWRVADVRVAEERLMARLPSGALMQRAAAGLARRCASVLGRVYGSRVLLLVGGGNNGGDALYAGALLARRGAAVSALLLVPDRAHLGGLAALRRAGGRTVTALPGHVDLVVDGILGIGGRGGLRAGAAEVVRALPAAPVVAVDLPSGVDADTGAVAGDAVVADVTVTFGCLKPGLVVGEGARRAGQVEVVDIGLTLAGPDLLVPDIDDVAAHWPWPTAGDDKYTRGVVGVAAGSAAYPGAAVLATAGASAGPAGYIRYAGGAVEAVRAAHPHVVTAERVADAGRVQAWVAGPGLGTDDAGAAALRSVLAARVPVCVDADGLTLLAGHPDWLHGHTAPVVLTPHDREFARLAGAEPGADRVASARDLARRLGATVLLKGDRTVVAGPDGTAYANPTGTPALASAGTGDVLAGLLGALLAAGVESTFAAAAAAFVHGLAGREAGAAGPVTSPDVAAALRPVVARLRRVTSGASR